MKKSDQVLCAWHGLIASRHLNCSANLCLPFSIIPSVETFTERAGMGTNITLLSICDLLALHPPSSATMEKSKGEGGGLPHYSGMYWWCTSSRITDSIRRTKVWERLQILAQEVMEISPSFSPIWYNHAVGLSFSLVNFSHKNANILTLFTTCVQCRSILN